MGAGRVRGLLLHKLMEEVLTGELLEDIGQFADRARALLAELALESAEDDAVPDYDEIAAIACRTSVLPANCRRCSIDHSRDMSPRQKSQPPARKVSSA